MNTFYLALGLGMQEMVVIFLIVLLLFGAKKIPELARGVGKGMGEFKKAKHEFEREIKMGEDEGKREWDKPVVDRPVVDRPVVDRPVVDPTVEDGTHPHV